MKRYLGINKKIIIFQVASSDLECVFRCTSDIDEKLIENKYKETMSDMEQRNFGIIGSADTKYYCSNIKPLYIVKL